MVPSSVSEELDSVAIIGGGPAGLTCAYELQRLSPSHRPIVLEGSGMVGGIARTDSHNGYRFDIGGHRFFTKVGEVEELWHEIMGDEFITVPRLSRIYYRGKYFDYPLKIFNALGNMGLIESIRIGLSVIRWQAFPRKPEETFEDWVVNRFGQRLFEHFFKSYTEKVWGVPCSEIRADWAAQRIKNLSLFKAVWNAISGANDTASLIEEFQYPRLGPGQMWEVARARIREAGGEVRMCARVERVFREGEHVTGIEVAETDAGTGAAQRYTLRAEQYVNSMALRELIAAFDPPPPAEVIAAANRLKYRDFMIMTLVLDHADPFPDNWIYVHEPQVQVGRIQNFRAWSREMLPADKRETTASIGMEYFCNDTDPLWAMKDEELIALAGSELEKIGLAPASSVIDGCVIRQPKAYPVYDSEYAQALGVVRDWLARFDNFQTVGRNGQHRYNNQDHSMLTAMLAARNILGEHHDIWAVNVERSYHEEFQTRPYRRRAPAAA